MLGKIICSILISAAFISSHLFGSDDEPDLSRAMQVIDHASLMHRLKTLVIDQLDCSQVSTKEALNLLAKATRKADPQQGGVNFVFDRTDLPNRVSLHIKKVTARYALDQICAQSSLIYRVDTAAVSLDWFNGDGLCKWSYYVSSKFLKVGPEMEIQGQRGCFAVEKQLEQRGIRFPPGTSAYYEPATKTVTMISTFDEVMALDDYLNP